MTAWRLCREPDIDLAASLPALLRGAGVIEVEIIKILRPPSFLGREVSEEARDLARTARHEYRQRGFGFWEFLLTSATQASAPTRAGILDRAVRHGGGDAVRETLTIDELGCQLETGEFTALNAREVVSLSSRVSVSELRTSMHLPMLDFTLEADRNHDAIAVEMLSRLGLSGNLYTSGTSYHYFGSEPVSGQELPQLLGHAQLLGPLIDHRWISHQLIDAECSLRISSDTERHRSSHHLVATTG